MEGLSEEFSTQFDVVHVHGPELRREVYRLRYRVLGQQLGIPGFEPWRFPDGEERDSFDDRSAHCLLRHRPTGAIAGAVRLVLCDPGDVTAPFPLEAYCEAQLGARPGALQGVPRRQVGEISRLFLTRPFEAPMDRERFPSPMLGLLKAVFEMAMRHGVTHLYAMMEPRLNRLLRALSVDFEPIGPVVDCHGRRRPHAVDGYRLLARVGRERPWVWEVLTGKKAVMDRQRLDDDCPCWSPTGATA